MKLNAEVTQEHIDAGRLLGMTGAEVIESAIHSELDRLGVPRNGREVEVTAETITIDLPAGYTHILDD